MAGQQQGLPQRIEPFRLAEAGRTLQGRLPVQRLRRLADLLWSDQGQVEVELHFGVDQDGQRRVVGRLQADLRLICQRCLEAMNYPVDTRVGLAFVENDHDAAKVVGDYDAYAVGSDLLMLTDLIEDELLLCLPQVALHELAECPARDMPGPADEVSGTDTSSENPFAVLEKLKTQDSD